MRICTIEDCNSKHFSKGYCQKHYRQIERRGKILERTLFDPNEFVFIGDDCIIKLYDKRGNYKAETIIDKEDYEKVKDYKWHLGEKYVKTKVDGKTIRLHNLLTGNIEVDHKDRNKLNNRKENLRKCSHLENCRNRDILPNNTSGYKGVHWSKRNKKWVSGITLNGKLIYLGLFINKEDAAKAYNEAAIKYSGEFAVLNTIQRRIK